MKNELKDFLEAKVDLYNQPSFIKDDPISVPHLFSKKQDIEIAGLFAAIFAWGNRTTIIQKSRELMQRMDGAPHDFIVHHEETERRKLLGFKHRTFNDTDLLYFTEFLQQHYRKHTSLEQAFTKTLGAKDKTIENALIGFHDYFRASPDCPGRTLKHVATPARKSACKRLNMYLRWMVRRDNKGVDFGIWKKIKPSQLVCPVDVHVGRVAKRFQLLDRPNADWEAALQLTEYLRTLDPVDPVKYDFALFALGVVEKL